MGATGGNDRNRRIRRIGCIFAGMNHMPPFHFYFFSTRPPPTSVCTGREFPKFPEICALDDKDACAIKSLAIVPVRFGKKSNFKRRAFPKSELSPG